MSRGLRILMELTTAAGEAVYVNPPHVRAVAHDSKGARLEFSDGPSLIVRQRAEDVASRIDRWLSAAYLGDRYDR